MTTSVTPALIHSSTARAHAVAASTPASVPFVVTAPSEQSPVTAPNRSVHGIGQHGCVETNDQRAPAATLPVTWHRRTGTVVIALLHGFTQTGVSWRPVIEALSPFAEDGDLAIATVDLPGHGQAPPGLDGSDLATGAALAIEALGPSRPTVLVGYSMGGRVALRAALDRLPPVAATVLIGATAGIDDPEERSARRSADAALAAEIEAGGVPAFLERWLAQPLFAGLSVADDDLAARAANRAEGLAASLRGAGTGTMDPAWWDDLPRIDVPTTVAVGGLDSKFLAIGRRLVAGIGDRARLEVIPDVGHAAHLQRPDAVARIIAEAAADVRG